MMSDQCCPTSQPMTEAGPTVFSVDMGQGLGGREKGKGSSTMLSPALSTEHSLVLALAHNQAVWGAEGGWRKERATEEMRRL